MRSGSTGSDLYQGTMNRTLALVVVMLVGCRMNFDPVEEEEVADPDAIGSTQTSSTITAEPGSDLSYDCEPGLPCMVDCSEALTCIVDCEGATTCDVLCAPAGCIVNTCTAPRCEVDCGLGQKSVVNDTHFCTED